MGDIILIPIKEADPISVSYVVSACIADTSHDIPSVFSLVNDKVKESYNYGLIVCISKNWGRGLEPHVEGLLSCDTSEIVGISIIPQDRANPPANHSADIIVCSGISSIPSSYPNTASYTILVDAYEALTRMKNYDDDKLKVPLVDLPSSKVEVVTPRRWAENMRYYVHVPMAIVAWLANEVGGAGTNPTNSVRLA